MSSLVQGLVDALSIGSTYALVALGVALIFGIMRLINFAYGEYFMVAAYAMLAFDQVSLALSFLFVIAAVVAFSLLTERVAFRPLRNADPSTLMITSFAVSYLVQKVAIVATLGEARTVQIPESWLTPLQFGGISIGKLEIIITVAALAMMGGLNLLLTRTALGIQMRAAAQDFRMARLLGVAADRVIMSAFAIAGFLAAIGGFLYVAKLGSFTPAIGLPILLAGIVSTVIGGLGSLKGAVIGGYLLGAIQVLLQIILPSDLVAFRDALVFILVIVLLLFKPTGLFGSYVQRV
ncbi:MAG: branched-chain amino acid ABC transporter permease [Rhodobacteraceae bacterium]|jgi:branched-chain amino acid transport system permease protein|nr:branched-chain amino acid ABC transporter permease [Paracoccaceae bacterium]